jgi:hypothetical protein
MAQKKARALEVFTMNMTTSLFSQEGIPVELRVTRVEAAMR